jgi:hypothetical protein
MQFKWFYELVCDATLARTLQVVKWYDSVFNWICDKISHVLTSSLNHTESIWDQMSTSVHVLRIQYCLQYCSEEEDYRQADAKNYTLWRLKLIYMLRNIHFLPHTVQSVSVINTRRLMLLRKRPICFQVAYTAIRAMLHVGMCNEKLVKVCWVWIETLNVPDDGAGKRVGLNTSA